jgi:hypothetical protein
MHAFQIVFRETDSVTQSFAPKKSSHEISLDGGFPIYDCLTTFDQDNF